MIERLYAHNFRCLENFTLDFAGRPSALIIGKNGSGKSTVLDCFRLFQRIGRGSGRIRDLVSASDFAQHRIDRPMRFAVELTHDSGRFLTDRLRMAAEFPRGSHLGGDPGTRRGRGIPAQHSQIQLAGGQSFELDWHTGRARSSTSGLASEVQDLKAFFATMMLIAPVPARMTGYA